MAVGRAASLRGKLAATELKTFNNDNALGLMYKGEALQLSTLNAYALPNHRPLPKGATMNLDYFFNRLSENRKVFESLLRDVPAEQTIWKPSSEKWSMLEVVNHLYDEEREDFRSRLELTLKDPAEPWPGIDPQGWVVTRKYSERELGPSLDSFLSEREKSLSWLKGLSAPAWQNRHEVSGRSRTAGDLLASWLAHDFLHIRQLTRLHWQYISVTAAPYETTYAGPWKET